MTPSSYVVCMEESHTSSNNQVSCPPGAVSAGSAAPETNKSFKHDQLPELSSSKRELQDSISDNTRLLKNIKDAEDLDKRLPDRAKQSNRYLNELKNFHLFLMKIQGILVSKKACLRSNNMLRKSKKH